MRILHVITTVDPKSGGPIEGIRQLVNPVNHLGHHLEVVTTDSPDADYIQNFPAPLHCCGPAIGNYAYCPAIYRWLDKHVAEFDAIIANGIWQYPNIAVRLAARRHNLPYWVFTHGMLDPYFNRAYPLKRLKKSLYWPFQYAVLRDARAVLFTCEEERLLAREAFKPYKVTERVVNYGTAGPDDNEAAQRAAFRAAFPQLAGKPFLLFLSRVHPKKGVDLLLRAWRETEGRDPNLQLAIAGPVDADYKEALQKIIDGYPSASTVHWLGMVQGDAKWGAFRESEAFILPSHQENFGIAVVEALACGTPVLITHPVNIWREIEQDGAGIVVEDTFEGITELLSKWNSTGIDARSEMAKAAIDCFHHRFTIARAAESLIDVIKDQLRNPQST